MKGNGVSGLWCAVGSALLCLISGPASAASHWTDCLVAPTYQCLVEHAAAEAGQVPGRAARAYAVALVAGAQAVGGRAEEARGSAEDAILLGSIISDPADYGFLVSQLTWARAWAGDLDMAGDMLGWTSDPYALALGYAALAEAQAHHGYPEYAERSLRWAMEEAANVKSDRGLLLPYLAISHGYVGNAEGVHRLIAEARNEASSSGSAYERALAAAAGAVAEAMIGHVADSDTMLSEAEARLGEIEDETDIGVLASHLAWALAEAGDAEGARGVIKQIVQLELASLTYQRRALIFSYAALALSRAK
ncbi:MAG: hypothetical protein JSU82_13670 [Rhodospirillales bacterium]|nr:MAG: hypothetical protein JSU82_13670 [Rhodospirillales bacterium]